MRLLRRGEFGRPLGLISGVFLVATPGFLLSCAPGQSNEGAAPRPAVECLVSPDAAIPIRPVVNIVVREPFSLDSADRPRNLDERLVMRQLYETLVRVDCGGTILPALAEQWTRDDQGLLWTFRLRNDLRAIYGLPIDAALIRNSWANRKNGGIWPVAEVLDVDVVGPLELRVRLATPHRELPAFFADPSLAVTGSDVPGRMPGETGRFRHSILVVPRTGPMRRLWQLEPVDPNAQGPLLRVELIMNQVDQRDALDFPEVQTLRAADLMVTRDPLVLSYALGRSDLNIVALPWDRSYVVITPDSSSLARKPEELVQFQGSLRDVVRAEVRPAAAPFWWQTDTRCVRPTSARRSMSSQVVYPSGDPTARELAERVVALAGPVRLRIQPLASDELRAALASGNAAAFIIALPRTSPINCQELPQWPANSRILPLVDSRPHLVVRRGVPAFSIDADGAIRFLPIPR
ncbi:MAG: hypothetical protein ABI679_13685 [Gemmatimonadota bacterium]